MLIVIFLSKMADESADAMKENLEEDAGFAELRERMRLLKKKDRRRTLEQLTLLYTEEEQGKKVDDKVVQVAAQVPQSTVNNIVVESAADRRLPRFSGASKLGQGEVSFHKWQRAADRLQEEESASEEQKKKAILRSLVGEADDIADMSRHKSVGDIINVLKMQYGSLIDGEELLMDFYNVIQKDKQTASEYVSDLYVELGEVVKHGGLAMHNIEKVLLKQFIRGCSDEELLTKLRFEQYLKNPPAFPHIIQYVRREEAERTARRLRHKKLARAQALKAEPVQEAGSSGEQEMELLRLRVRELEAQVTAAPVATPVVAPAPTAAAAASPELAQIQQRLASIEQNITQVRSKNFVFCYRCGEADGHFATDCVNPPNKKLVAEKQQERKQRYANKYSKN